MGLRFIGRDPECSGKNCPAVWLDEETGDVVIQGWEITDAAELSVLGPVAPNEKIVRLPAGMRSLIQEAFSDGGTNV
ncbi:hypothetical protein [Actinoplanes subglobosus]|uniref:Uncharacterized protein n=1 Tax=Actinoplanes subglobosus TaxID=1547892 RepID=A0ABV8IQ57_9ACTN